MKILKVNKLRGPNIWSNYPVLEAWVDLEEMKDTSSEMIPGFNERLMSWLPTMVEHRCSIGEFAFNLFVHAVSDLSERLGSGKSNSPVTGDPSKFANNFGCLFRVDLSGSDTSDYVVVHLGAVRGFNTGFNETVIMQ
jgi:hypothetical protein